VTKAERLKRTRAVYARMFLDNDGKLNTDGEFVLLELRKFCRVEKAALVVSPQTISTDKPATYYQMGLRDAYEHIVQILRLDPLANASEYQQEKAANERAATAATE
jgi:hypothetical protein